MASSVLYYSLYYILFTVLTIIILSLIFDKLSSSMDSQIVEIDGMHYMVPVFNGFQKDPRSIKDVGSVLVCESLAEIMNQKVKMNYPVPEARSVTTGNSIFVDCFHQGTNSMADYLPEKHYKFNGPDIYNENEYDFYDRHALESIKLQKISENKANYVQVPYLVDMCEYDDDKEEYNCNGYVDRDTRKNRIKTHLRKQLAQLF